jgi:uncharacterized surface protein with fasciclin (FAS1) repeats
MSPLLITAEVLQALKKTLGHLENLQVFAPQDKSFFALKRGICNRIAEIEARLKLERLV